MRFRPGEGLRHVSPTSGGRLRKVATRLVVVGLLLPCFGLLAAAGAAGRAPALKPLAAAVDVTQTCSTRVPRNSRINVRATLSNPGTEQLLPSRRRVPLRVRGAIAATVYEGGALAQARAGRLTR
jgi:hypothetical protein